MSCPSAAEFDGKFLKNVNYETQCLACRQLQIDKVYTELIGHAQRLVTRSTFTKHENNAFWKNISVIEIEVKKNISKLIDT